MDTKRFGIMAVMISVAVMVMLFISKAQRDAPQPTETQEDPAAQVAEQTQPAPPAQVAAQPQPAQAVDQSEPAPPAQAAAAQAKPSPTLSVGQANSTRRQWAQDRHPARKLTIGSLDPDSPIPFQVELVTQGASINTVKLASHFATVADKKLYNEHKDDPAGYAAALAADPQKYQGHYSLLNPVPAKSKVYRSLATNMLTVKIGGQTYKWQLDQLNWKVDSDGSDDPHTISFSYVLYRDYNFDKPGSAPDEQPFLTLIKTYSVAPGDHSVAVSLDAINHSYEQVSISLDQFGPTGIPREDLRADQRMAKYAYLSTEKGVVDPIIKPITEIAPGSKEGFRTGRKILLGKSSDSTDPMLWLGYTNKFFGSMLYLKPIEADRLPAGSYNASFYLMPLPETENSRAFLTGLDVQEIDLPAGAKVTMDFDLFAGAKRFGLFSNPEAQFYKGLYQELDYKSTIDLRTTCTFDWITHGMIWLLGKLSWLALGNYGVAIICLVVLVRICLHPLTKKGQISMMKMQKLGPKTQALKEKYGDDKEALNKEMMRMYKEQGASPLLGCLPMMLQMPIWIALFSTLNASVDLRHAAFFPVWLTDLAAPDALFGPWDKTLPIQWLSNIKTFNLLPLLVTLAMFLQMKMNPQMSGAQPQASPEAASQQKMMKYMMPLMMLMFFYNAPSGLNLYIMTSMFASIAEQKIIRRHIKAKEELDAALETRVDMPGKAARSARPKKPKGPNWVKRG